MADDRKKQLAQLEAERRRILEDEEGGKSARQIREDQVARERAAKASKTLAKSKGVKHIHHNDKNKKFFD